MLKIEGVTKIYGSKTILKSINLNVPDGETWVILGSSGSGKSTLLRIIIGLIPKDSGTVSFDGVEQEKIGQQKWAEVFGYVPQDGGLFPHMTALENVTMMARLAGWDKQKISERVRELAKLVSLEEDLLLKFPKQLSGGQKQRVSIMRACFLDPKLLIFDEPLGALDPLIRSDLQSEFKRIFAALKKTVILVTHDLAEAAFLGHKISLLNEGVIVQTGGFQEFIKNPATEFVKKFINAQRATKLMEESL